MVQQVLFYFSGHGSEEEQALCVGPQGQQQFINALDLTTALANIGGPDTTRVVIFDCCHADLMVPHLNAPNLAGWRRQNGEEQNEDGFFSSFSCVFFS